MGTLLAVLTITGLSWALAYRRAALWIWTAAIAAGLGYWSVAYPVSFVSLVSVWSVFVAAALMLNLPFLRRRLVSNYLLQIFRRVLPPMSDTEREALEAGSVWWEAELFRGNPRWQKLLDIPAARLSEEEQAFLDGPVEELCRMLDDWDITHVRRDLPPAVWRFLKEKGFFGLIVPRRYGGLEFSAQAHSAVVMKTASRSVTAAVTVMVPNSLGPAELLLHYGTEAQKNHYLPRLASGEEVPCFALTNPEAGSDASAMPDQGVVCRGEFEGKKDVLGIRLNWEKRYITLGPVATVLGLAFKLYDPDHLLGGNENLGITLALIPTNTPRRQNRHAPQSAQHPVPERPQLGRGRVHSARLDHRRAAADRPGLAHADGVLAAGRSISLPALSTGAGKLACRATGAYARIRKQFKLPIGKFEGVEEALARMAGTPISWTPRARSRRAPWTWARNRRWPRRSPSTSSPSTCAAW